MKFLFVLLLKKFDYKILSLNKWQELHVEINVQIFEIEITPERVNLLRSGMGPPLPHLCYTFISIRNGMYVTLQ